MARKVVRIFIIVVAVVGIAYSVWSACKSYPFDSGMAHTELFTILILIFAGWAAYSTYTKVADSSKKLDIDLLLKIAAIFGAALFFIYKVFAGYLDTGITLSAECTHHGGMAVVRAKVSKGSGTYVKLVKLVAFPTEVNGGTVPSLTFSNPLDLPGTQRVPYVIAGPYNQVAEQIRVNPGDSLEFANTFSTGGKAYHVQVILYAKAAFDPHVSQWNAACVVTPAKER